MSAAPHIPVLLNEVLDALAIQPGETHVDGTFGAGGYTRAILRTGARVIAFDRDSVIHAESFARLRGLVLDELTAFHRANPLKPGMSREELRGRAGSADERLFAFLLSALDTEGVVKTDRDKARLASHEVRLSAEQIQRFRAIIQGNNRPVQPLNGRIVKESM